MILCKIESEVLSKAMKSRNFFALRLYLNDYFKEEDDVFVSEIRKSKYNDKWEVGFRLSLDDYFCNEDEEVNRLLEFAKALGSVNDKGEPIIRHTIVKTIEF